MVVQEHIYAVTPTQNVPENSSVNVNNDANTKIPDANNINNGLPKFCKQICPICSSTVKYYFVNLNLKMLMCENVECDYPFSYQMPEFAKIDDDLNSDDEVDPVKVRERSDSPTATSCQSLDWAEDNRFDEDSQSESTFGSYVNKTTYIQTTLETVEENAIKSNVESIKQNLKLLQKPKKECIKNEAYIKNLMKLQQISGVKLLKPEEMELVKENEVEITSGLKIDIVTSDHKMSSIKIELADNKKDLVLIDDKK